MKIDDIGRSYLITLCLVGGLVAGMPMLLVGCRQDKDPVGVNQCLRSQLFKLCIETNKPAEGVEGVERVGLIEACGRQARDQALLRKSAVQPEQCWIP